MKAKRVTIDGGLYELIPSQIEPDGTYTLRPIQSEEVKEYELNFGNWEGIFKFLLDKTYELTEAEAKLVAEAIESFMELLFLRHPMDFYNGPCGKAAAKAISLIQKRLG